MCGSNHWFSARTHDVCDSSLDWEPYLDSLLIDLFLYLHIRGLCECSLTIDCGLKSNMAGIGKNSPSTAGSIRQLLQNECIHSMMFLSVTDVLP